MVQLLEIKKEIEQLPKQEYDNLRHWFAEKDWKIWDKQIKENSNSGKIDFLAKEALEEKNNGDLKVL
ncbi:MAG: hypothetical protein J7K84_04775 [Deltaproteobacteria bacterium]|nr:hypothetical protein [Deltaproteobacteria bacterium]